MTKQLNVFEVKNVGPNGVVQIPLNMGFTYNKILLNLTGAITKAGITNIKLDVNGRNILSYATAAHVDSFNSYKGNNVTAGVLEFDFTERLMKTSLAQNAGALVCDGGFVKSAVLSFQLNGYTPPGGITAVFDAAPVSTDLTATVVRQFDVSVSGAMWVGVPIPYGIPSGLNIKRVLMIPSTGTISAFRFKQDGIDLVQELTQTFNEALQRTTGHTPQAGAWMHDFLLNNNIAEVQNTRGTFFKNAQGGSGFVPVNSVECAAQTSAAMTLKVYVEALANLTEL